MVDAACTLPIFIIAVGMLLFLVAEAGIEDGVQYAMVKAAGNTITTMAVCDAAGDREGGVSEAAAYAAYAASLSSALREEWTSDSRPNLMLHILNFGVEAELSGGGHIDNVIVAHVGFDTKIPVVSAFIKSLEGRRSIAFRPWVGESEKAEDFDDTTVYVFPKSGERYHNMRCSCLREGDIQVLLSAELRKSCSSCELCKSGELPNGAPVFMFSGGTSFHRKSCSSVTKSFEAMALSDAVRAGYSACGLCGGLPENYNPGADPFGGD